MDQDLGDAPELDRDAVLRGRCLHADPVAHAERVDERDAAEIEHEPTALRAREQLHQLRVLVDRTRQHQGITLRLDLHARCFAHVRSTNTLYDETGARSLGG
jgi:hypothetical protein